MVLPKNTHFTVRYPVLDSVSITYLESTQDQSKPKHIINIISLILKLLEGLIHSSKMNSSSNDTIFNVTNIEIASEDDHLFSIIYIILQVLLFSIGLFINLKLIRVCYKDKGITWQISITHSIVMIVNYGFIIPFYAVTHFVPFLSQYTGRWLCYTASLVVFYGYQAIMANSLVISMLKYIFIVHSLKARTYGEDKIKNYFFWGNVISPLLLAIVALLTSDMKARPSLISCFGDTQETLTQNSATSSEPGNFVFNTSTNREDYNIVVFYVIQFLYIFRIVFNCVIATNLPEGFLYYKIFKKMKR